MVEYLIQNNTSDVKKIDLSLRVDSDLSPVWLGERSGMIDSRDTLLGIKENNAIIVKDSLNEWYAGISSARLRPGDVPIFPCVTHRRPATRGPQRCAGHGVDASVAGRDLADIASQ